MSARYRPPAWVSRLLRSLLPADYGSEILGYLEADARRRFAEDSPLRARIALWYLAQVGSPSMVALVLKLRTREGRPGWAADLRADVRATLRGLRRNRLFAAAAILSLGLGIGANAAIFGAVNGVLLRPLPYDEPDRLVFVWNRIPGFDVARLPLAGLQVAELRGEESAFEDVGGVWGTTQTLRTPDGAVLASAGLVTPNFFAVLGVEPALGRTFTENEGGTQETTVLVSDAFWKRELGADPSVVGRSLGLQGGDATIVGVLPAGFTLHFPADVGVPEHPDVYTPFPWIAADRPGARFLRTVARLRPGVSASEADAVVREVTGRLAGQYAEFAETGDELRVVPLQADAVASVRPALLALMAGVLIFLLMTAGNVANLVLARGLSRAREVAIRRCLGASAARIARLFLTEVAMLTAAGTVVGLALGAWGGQALWAFRPPGLARVEDVGIDMAVFAFTLLAAALAGGVSALAPLVALRRRAPMASLRRAAGGEEPGPGRARPLVIGAEVALSVVLVVGTALVGRSLVRLQSADLGFDAERVLTFRVGLPIEQFPEDSERALLAQRIEDALSAEPGVVAAGGTSHMPLAEWANWSGSAPPESAPEEAREGYHFDHRSVTPGYFRTIGATLTAGRYFDASDVGAGQPVVIVDDALAERAFPDGDALGRVLLPDRYVGGEFPSVPAIVVGVISGLRDASPARASSGQVFWPFAQSARWELTFAARTRGDPTLLTDRARTLVREVSPSLAATDFRTLESYVWASLSEARFTSLFAGVLSVVALLLAGVGLYGIMSYTTQRRTRDMGLRLALGARGRDLFARVLREGLGVGLAGVLVGLLAAAAVSGYLKSLLYEVEAHDPVVFVGVAAFLLLVSAVASVGPALRATRVDPVGSLRAE